MLNKEKLCFTCGASITFGPSETLCDTLLCEDCAKQSNDEIQAELTSQGCQQAPDSA
jgi:hypothetical protein